MHACGHDGHTSALLGFLSILKDIDCQYNLILIFQHSEEEGSGSRDIMKYLYNDKIDAIYGFHIMPLLAKNSLYSSDSLLMYGSYEINIEIYGKSTHVGNRDQAIDSIYISSILIQYYRQYNDGIIHIGVIKGGSIRNGVSDYVLLKGTIRAKSEQSLDKIKEYLDYLHTLIMKEYHCDIHICYKSHYYPLTNNKSLYNHLTQYISINKLNDIYMYAEDFSYYLKYIPGVFIFIGTGNNTMLHTSDFYFDESILKTIINVYKKIVTI